MAGGKTGRKPTGGGGPLFWSVGNPSVFPPESQLSPPVIHMADTLKSA